MYVFILKPGVRLERNCDEANGATERRSRQGIAVFQKTSLPAAGRPASGPRKFGVFGFRVSCLEFASLVQKETAMRALRSKLNSILDRYVNI